MTCITCCHLTLGLETKCPSSSQNDFSSLTYKFLLVELEFPSYSIKFSLFQQILIRWLPWRRHWNHAGMFKPSLSFSVFILSWSSAISSFEMSPISQPSSLFPLPPTPAVAGLRILSLYYNSLLAGLHTSISSSSIAVVLKLCHTLGIPENIL